MNAVTENAARRLLTGEAFALRDLAAK